MFSSQAGDPVMWFVACATRLQDSTVAKDLGLL